MLPFLTRFALSGQTGPTRMSSSSSHLALLSVAVWFLVVAPAVPGQSPDSPGASPAAQTAADPQAAADAHFSHPSQVALKIPASYENHPLVPAIAVAADGYEHIRQNIRDYTCIMVRRERVDGVLGDHEFIFAKVRHRQLNGDRIVVPFSVYLKFLKPRAVVGREVLYVEQRYNNEMFVRRGGTRFAYVTMQIHPTSELALRGNRYPITEFGIENLVRRLLEASHQALAVPCDVQFLRDARVNDRPCRAIVVTHTQRSQASPFFQVRIFIDDELNVPVHYEAYDWPDEEGGQPQLVEQYTYTRLQLNVGLTDSDFDPTNPEYRLR